MPVTALLTKLFNFSEKNGCCHKKNHDRLTTYVDEDRQNMRGILIKRPTG